MTEDNEKEEERYASWESSGEKVDLPPPPPKGLSTDDGIWDVRVWMLEDSLRLATEWCLFSPCIHEGVDHHSFLRWTQGEITPFLPL